MEEQKTLKKQAAKAIGWDMLGTFATRGIDFIVSIFLARLLTPSDFGIVGMSMVFIGLSQMFTSAGFGAALIQRQNNTSLTYSSVFYFNIFIGFLLFGLFQILAEPIAIFYENESIESIIRYLSFSIPISSLSVVQTTILTKELRFKELSLRALLAGSISGIIGVILAFSGYGVYALVAQFIIATIITVIVLWKVSDWRPKWEFSWMELKKLLSFSGYVFAGQISYQIILRLDALVIGKVFNSATLGYYTRAESLNRLVIVFTSSSIGKVLFPTLSKIQNNKEQYKLALLSVLKIVSFLVFLLSGMLILSVETIIINLFGEKWRPSIIIFQILMLRIFAYPINSILLVAMKSMGLAKQEFFIGMIRHFIRLMPFIVLIYVRDLDYFLYGLLVTAFTGTVINISMVSHYLQIKPISFYHTFKSTVFPYIAILVFLFYTDLFGFFDSSILRDLVSVLFYAALYLTVVFLIDSKLRNQVLFYSKKVRGMLQKKD